MHEGNHEGNPVLAAIHAERGLATKIGKELNITRAAVAMWKRVPPRHAVRVAQMFKMPLHIVCPEVWPPPRKRRKTAGFSNAPH